MYCSVLQCVAVQYVAVRQSMLQFVSDSQVIPVFWLMVWLVVARFFLLMHVWHDSYFCVIVFAHECVTWLVTWPIHNWFDIITCEVADTYVTWCDSFIGDMVYACVTWLIQVWHDAFVREIDYALVTWLLNMGYELVLQCVALYCSVLQCAAVCCSVLQCVAVCCNMLQYVIRVRRWWHDFVMCDMTLL